MKPDWAYAPEWANWLAMDAPDPDEGSGGYWWWYAEKPVLSEILKGWYVCRLLGRLQYIHYATGDFTTHWQDSLEARPC